MQEGVKDFKMESVSAKAEHTSSQELSGKGPEAVFTRTSKNRRLLRRSTSQCLLLNENKKDSDSGRNSQDSSISSKSSGLLFAARPLSSSTKQKATRPSLFPRPKSSLMNVTTGAPRSRTASDSDSDRYIRKASSKLSSNSSTKTSDPNLARRSSYFSLQSLRRSISLDAGSAARRLSKRASRDEKAEWRFGHGFKGIVTAIDEEEQEERRQLVRLCLYLVSMKNYLYALLLKIQKLSLGSLPH